MEEKPEELLQVLCDHCYDFLYVAYILPCGHKLCAACVAMALEEDSLGPLLPKRMCPDSPPTGDRVTCPVCKRKVPLKMGEPGEGCVQPCNALKKNAYSTARKSCIKKIICECEKKNPAKHFCVDCKAFVCGICARSHKAKNHDYIDFGGSRKNMPPIDACPVNQFLVMCSVHQDNPAEWASFDDSTMYCRRCAPRDTSALMRVDDYVMRKAFYLRGLADVLKNLGKNAFGRESVDCLRNLLLQQVKALFERDPVKYASTKAMIMEVVKRHSMENPILDNRADLKHRICGTESLAVNRICNFVLTSEFPKRKAELEAKCDQFFTEARFGPEAIAIVLIPCGDGPTIYNSRWKPAPPLEGCDDLLVRLINAFNSARYCEMAALFKTADKNLAITLPIWLLFLTVHPYQPFIFECVENPKHIKTTIEQHFPCGQCVKEHRKYLTSLIERFPDCDMLVLLRDVLLAFFMSRSTTRIGIADKVLEDLSNKDFPPAHFTLAERLQKKGDNMRATRCLHMAAAHGNAIAEHKLFCKYTEGDCVPKCKVMADFYYERSNARGYIPSAKQKGNSLMSEDEGSRKAGKDMIEKAQLNSFLRMAERCNLPEWNSEDVMSFDQPEGNPKHQRVFFRHRHIVMDDGIYSDEGPA